MSIFERKGLLGWLALFLVGLTAYFGFDRLASNTIEIDYSQSSTKGSVADALTTAEPAYDPASMIEIEGSSPVSHAGSPAVNTSNGKILSIDYPIVQTFNNCPAGGLAITLSYYGIVRTQKQLADELRPNWNLNGKNDDKSTPPERVAEGSKKYGLIPYYRANGSIELLKKLIANDTPILMRTRLNMHEDYHHYRVVKGYDDATKEIIQDDSYDGPNIRFKYSDFLKLWKVYNYEYLVFATPLNKAVIEKILAAELDPMVAWKNAAARAEGELARNPTDNAARFNLAVSLYYAEDYTGAVAEFEKVESSLSRYALWFRIEPIKAYFELKNDARVFSLADKIFAAGNLGYSELYLLRGQTYLRAGQRDLARSDFERAVFYNKNLKGAQEALASLKAE